MRQCIYDKNFDDSENEACVYIAVDRTNILFLCFKLAKTDRDLDDVYTPMYTIDQIKQLIECYKNHKDICIADNQLQIAFINVPIKMQNAIKRKHLFYLNSCNVDSDCPDQVLYNVNGTTDQIIEALQTAVVVATANCNQ